MFKALFFSALIVIEYLATTSKHIPIVEHIWDKANHFSAFLVLYWLLSLAYRELNLVIKFAILIAFGMQIEIVQHFIPAREFSLLDVVADTIGVALGAITFAFFRKRW